jgi:diacylglycerol kinase family enzyme
LTSTPDLTRQGAPGPAGAPGVRRAVVLVNERAGEVLQRGRDAFAKLIEEGFAAAGMSAQVRCVEARKLGAEFSRAVLEKPDVVVVAGGDGTISLMLPAMAKVGVDSAALPLGTLNLLARDLGLDGTLEQNLQRIADGVDLAIDLGEVNGRLFHSNAGLGFFAMMAREREEARRRFPFSKVLGFAFASVRTVLFARSIDVDMESEGERRALSADAVLITNNRFAGTPWRRASLDEGLLEVHLFEASSLPARLRAVAAMARGTWRELPSLTSFTTRELTISRRGRRRSTVAIDGEIVRVSVPMRFTIRPRALTLRAAGRDDLRTPPMQPPSIAESAR